MELHQLKECPNYELECNNKEQGCNMMIKRKDLEIHCLNDCLFRIIECPYLNDGCNDTFMVKDKIKHMKTKFNYHMQLLVCLIYVKLINYNCKNTVYIG